MSMPETLVPRAVQFPGRRFFLSLAGLGISLLIGCAAPVPPRSATTLAQPDPATVERLRQQMVSESQKFLATQDALNRDIRKTKVVPKIKPMVPSFDPLEGRQISVAMMHASIDQVLAAFADSARINLVIDPAVLRGGQLADMYLRDMSMREAFNEVLRVYDVAGEIQGNTLRVNLNEEKVFALDFLNSTTNMNMSSGGNVFGTSTSGGSGASGASSGTGGALNGTLTLSGVAGVKSDPYKEIEDGVQAILGNDLRHTVNNSNMGMAHLASAAMRAAPGAQTTGFDGSASTPVLPVQSGVDGVSEAALRQSAYSVNKVTGTLYVKARPGKMRSIERLINSVQTMLRKQVYIEAQLIDVQLSDNYSLGVDWTLLRNRVAATLGTNPLSIAAQTVTFPAGNASLPSTALTIPAATIGGATAAGLGIALQGNNINAAIAALEDFGNLQVLSNPNVQVRNGTPALMAVGSNISYVANTSSTLIAPGGGASTATSSVQTSSVFSGIMIGVVPFMQDDGRVELMVNPMQSDVDPSSLALVTVNSGNQVTLPVVNYKGLTTTLNVGDGDVVMVGGLIDQRLTKNDSGVPGTGESAFFSKLFGQTASTHSSRELVVVMRVHVL